MVTHLRRSLVVFLAALLTPVLGSIVAPSAAGAKAGDTITIPVPAAPGTFSTIVTGADGNLWWADDSANIYRTTLAGTTTAFVAPSSGTHVVAPGPDGNIWYVNHQAGADVVGRITPAGVITEFPVAGSQPLRSLTAGSDGNMWILFEAGDGTSTPTLGKVTTAGVITTYMIGFGSLQTSIVVGPGGRVWWLLPTNQSIKSATLANPTTTLQTYSVPNNGSPGFSPNSLQVGTDGNVWVGAGSGGTDYLLRLTPSGAQSAFSVQMNNASPQGLLTAPDGNIWFNGGGQLYRFNSGGTQTNFSSIGCACDPMTVGSDGRIWTFDSAGANLVGVSPGDTSNTVLNLASGFSSPDVRLAGFGTALRFVFTGPNSATATDSSGLGLFDSGSQAVGSHYDYTFPFAGTYTYQDTLQPSHTGTVEVPPISDKRYAPGCAFGSCGQFDVQWADDGPPPGFAYDVQWRPPGAGPFADHLIGTSQPSSLEQPYYPGTYQYRARLRRTSDNVATGYSPPVTVEYSNEYAAFSGFNTDVSVYRPSDGSWYRSPSSGTVYGGNGGDVPIPGDYDGDGVTDVAIYNSSTGLWAIHPSGLFTPAPDTFVTYGGIPGDIPIPADYDGDGKTDIAIFRPDFGTWWVHQSSTNTDVATTFGVSGDVAVPGADFDGDGKADLTIYRDGTWYVHRSSDGADTVTAFGGIGDVPVPGYYDGDTRLDIAVYRPSTGVWYFHPSTAPDTAIAYGGVSGDIPVPGDYDADGLTDVAVFRPSSGTWYIHYAAAGSSDSIQNWGAIGDIPLPLPTAVRLAFYPAL